MHCNDFPLLRLGWILILALTQGGTTIAKEQQSPAGCQESLSSLNQAWPHGCKAQREARQAFLPWTQEKRAAQEGCGYTGVSPVEATKMLWWTEHWTDEERPRAPGLLRIGGLGVTLLSAPTK